MPSKVRIVGRGAKEENGRNLLGPLLHFGTKTPAAPASASPGSDVWKDDCAILSALILGMKQAGLVSAPEAKQLNDLVKAFRDEAPSDTLPVDARLEEIIGYLSSKQAPKAELVRWLWNDSDHAATRLRMVVRRRTIRILDAITDLEEELVDAGKRYRHAAIPLHLSGSAGSVSSISHVLLGFGELFQHDVDRLLDGFADNNESPMGSGGGVPPTIELDRAAMAQSLSFMAPTAHSIVGVLSADVPSEFIFSALLVVQHVCQLAGVLDIWARRHGYVAFAKKGTERNRAWLDRTRFTIAAANVQANLQALQLLSIEPAPSIAYMERWTEMVDETARDTERELKSIRKSVERLVVQEETVRLSTIHPQLFVRDIVESTIAEGASLDDARSGAKQLLQRMQGKRFEASDEENQMLGLIDGIQALNRHGAQGGPSSKSVGRLIVRCSTFVARNRRMIPLLAKSAKRPREVGQAVSEKAKTDR